MATNAAILYVAAATKSLQLCPTLCDPYRRQPTKAPLSLGFSRQEYWSGFPLPSPKLYVRFCKFAKEGLTRIQQCNQVYSYGVDGSSFECLS